MSFCRVFVSRKALGYGLQFDFLFGGEGMYLPKGLSCLNKELKE